MKTPINKKTFPLGLVLFALALALYKAFMMSTEMGAGSTTALILLSLDAFYLALIVVVAMLQGFAGPKSLRVLFWLILVSMAAFYLLDTLVLLALDDHAALFDIGRYAPETALVLSFFDAATYAAIGLLLASLFALVKASTLTGKIGFPILLSLSVLAVWAGAYAPEPLKRYSMLNPAGLLDDMGSRQAVSAYSDDQIQFYAGLKGEKTEIPSSRPDVILLVVESLSSIHSKKISGNDGLLDDFDRLAEEGLLFRNFFANHQASEGGLIALLGGYPPMHFPTATPYMFDEFALQPSVLADYREDGYFTEFLTNADRKFIGLNHFLEGIGLDRSRGRDDVDAMKTAQRIVQDAPSDVLLFDEAMLTIRRLMADTRPFLLTIATTGTHLPYSHPDTGPDTAAAVWAWSMQQLAGFYRQLSDSGYFNQGVLLITGDHRQMQPLSIAETLLFGDSARARVPLLVIGSAYPRAAIDERVFQQADLLRMLDRIRQPATRLSPHPIWVERYNRKYGRIELIDHLSVFDEDDRGRREYRLKVTGNRIEWLDVKPEFARGVETRIHIQRSLHQHIRERLKGRNTE